LNERGIPIENIDLFKENYYDTFIEYLHNNSHNITELDDKLKVVAYFLKKMKDL